jgi:hypothetical protein
MRLKEYESPENRSIESKVELLSQFSAMN